MKLLIIVLAMLVTSAGALHSWYSKGLYVRAAQLSEAHTLAGEVKNRVSDHFIEYGVLPNSNNEAGLAVADSLFGVSVRRVSVLQGGVVEVDLQETGKGPLVSMVFSPTVISTSEHLYWQCSSRSIGKQVLQKLRPSCEFEAATPESKLAKAIKKQDLRRFNTMIEQGVNTDEFTHGITPLMLTASIGDPELLARLLSEGVDVDLQADNYDGLTALMIAIRNRHEPIVSLLLASGASVSVNDKHGLDARDHAEQMSDRFGDFRFSRLLLQSDNPQFRAHPAESSDGPMHQLTAVDRYESLKQKIKSLGDYCLYTTMEPLRSQIMASCAKAISALPESSVETPDVDLMTLNLAIDELEESILLEHFDAFVVSAEQINTRGVSGQSSLIKAISVNKPAVARLLIDRGADVNAVSAQRSRPLIEASKLGNTQLVWHLMREGAELNAADSFGRTALLAAVGRGHQAVVDSLIQAGAETKTKDANGVDALLLAKNRQFFAIERMLLAAPRS